MDSQDSAPWRPTGAEIARGKRLLAKRKAQWAQSRLALLAELKANPRRCDQELARVTGTRTGIVRGLLERWRTKGTAAVAQYGCPRALDEADLKHIKAEIKARRLGSLEQVGALIERLKGGLKLSVPCLHSYCRLMGIRLPARAKEVSKPNPPPVWPYRWSAEQIVELKGYAGPHQRRVKAVLRVGTEALSINRIAEAENVPATTLRLDLKRFKDGGLQGLVACWKKENVLLRRGIWPFFVKWCSDYYHEENKQVPPGEAAKAFLEDEHQLTMPLRSVYTHLTEWMLEAGIPLRTRARRVTRFIPSEGIKVRSL